jgi:hypothetical protein
LSRDRNVVDQTILTLRAAMIASGSSVALPAADA